MSDKTEREKQLDWLYRLKSNLKIFIPKDFHLAEFEQSLDYAISSIKTDLKYDLLYEETNRIANVSKMQEPTTKNDLGVDAVSRQEVLDLTADYDLSMGQVVKGIHALPSVTPQEPYEDVISRKSIKQKLQEHHDFFVNAYGGFSNLPLNDKSRVDEITNCIAMVVNEPSVTPQEPVLDKIQKMKSEIADSLEFWDYSPNNNPLARDMLETLTNFFGDMRERGT